MEIEAKYLVPDRSIFRRLLALTALGGYALRPAPELDLLDHYFDTSARALFQAGYALRLRAAGDHWRGTLKGLGGAEGALHQREEYELDVPPNALPVDWPASPARELALHLSGGQPLAELFTVRQLRTQRLIWSLGAEARLVAELSLDEVAYTHAQRQPPDLIVECELKGAGRPDDLTALQAALVEFGLTPQPQSKFARGLALLEAESEAAPTPAPRPPKAKSPGVRADMVMAEAGRRLLRFNFEKMLAQEAGARAGEDLEAVHAMRVAARRQRAALSLFAAYFQPKALRPFQHGLKAVAGCLGAVRDLDVQLAAARAYQAGLPPAAAAGLDPVLAAWTAERDAARAALVDHLDSRAFRRFQKSFGKFLATEAAGVARPSADPSAPVLVRDVLPARLWEHYGAVRAYAARLPAAAVPTLHALRIAGKRLRYVLEFFAGALGPGLPAAIAAVTALQDHLGELHDADVTLARLELYLQARHPRPRRAAVRAVEGYMQVQQARLRRLQRTARRPWKQIVGRPFREALGRAVARL